MAVNVQMSSQSIGILTTQTALAYRQNTIRKSQSLEKKAKVTTKVILYEPLISVRYSYYIEYLWRSKEKLCFSFSLQKAMDRTYPTAWFL